MVFQCINIRQVPWEVLKTTAFGLGFQHLPRDLANVRAWKTMFDPYNKKHMWRYPGKAPIRNNSPLKASDKGLNT